MRTRTMKKERRPLNRKKVKAKKTKKRYSDVLTVARQCLKKVNSEAIPDLNESCCSSKKSKKANSSSNDSWGGEKCSSFIRDKSAAHDKLVLRHPKCPDQFQIVRSVSDSRNKWSVVARQRIESDTAFGPFMGSVVMTSDKNMVQKLKDFERSRTCFQIAKKCNEYTFFDGSKSNNWMPHIRTASNDFNCVVFLSENNNGEYRIYYKTIKDVYPDEEIVVNNEGIINPDQYADKIAKGIRENQKQLDIQKRRMIKKGKEMQKDMLKKTKEMERLLSKKEKALRDQKTIGSADLYREAELEDMEALGKEMVRRGKEIEQMFNKSEVSSSRRSVRSSSRRGGSNKSFDIGKMFSTRCSGKKAESLSSRMERLSNVSKVKSKFSGCSKDFCPCAALGLDTAKTAQKEENKEESSDSEESESSKVDRLVSQALEPAAAKNVKSFEDSASSKVQRLMSQITQELAEDLTSEEQSEDQSSFNNDNKEDEESSQVTEETHTISSVGEVSDKPESTSSSSSGSSDSESGSSTTLPRPSNSAGASEKSEDEFENLFSSAGGYSKDKMDDEGSEQSENDDDNSEESENESENLFGSAGSTGEQNEETTNEVPALTSEMKRQVDVIESRSRNSHDVIVSRFGFDITGKKIRNFMGIRNYDLDNNDVINFYMTMIRNRSRDKPSMNMVQFLYTDFYKALVRGDPTHTWTEHCDIYSCDILFIPAKREHHWTLIAVDCVRKTITSYCYEKMEHPEVPKVVVEFLEQQHRWKRGRKLDFDEWKMDHQHRYRNGGGFNESAAFICTQAEFLSRNMELEYHGDDNVIKTMVYEIVNQKLVRSNFEARVHRCATEKCPIKKIADIPPLSPEQQMTFDVLMREKEYPEHSLVHKFGFNITSERAQNFLSDKDHCHLDGLINFYFIMIRNRAHDNSRMPMVQFLYTDFYKALVNEEPTHHWTEHCNIDSCDYLFIPAKRENKWTLIAVDCVHKSITSYSLCQLDHPDVPESLKEFLEHQHKWKRGKKLNLQEWEVDSHVCEVGSNYHHSLGDTAAYICVVGDLLSRNLEADFDRKKLNLAKKTIIVEIAGVNLTRNGFIEKEHRKVEPAPWPLNWKGSNSGSVRSQRNGSTTSQRNGSMTSQRHGSVASQKKRRRIEMFKKAVRRSRSHSRSASIRR